MHGNRLNLGCRCQKLELKRCEMIRSEVRQGIEKQHDSELRILQAIDDLLRIVCVFKYINYPLTYKTIEIMMDGMLSSDTTLAFLGNPNPIFISSLRIEINLYASIR